MIDIFIFDLRCLPVIINIVDIHWHILFNFPFNSFFGFFDAHLGKLNDSYERMFFRQRTNRVTRSQFPKFWIQKRALQIFYNGILVFHLAIYHYLAWEVAETETRQSCLVFSALKLDKFKRLVGYIQSESVGLY